jgi:uncharacterized membrane protein YhaH (DUF805 family)
MIEWYKKVVFENYANFKGRARRSEYWYFQLFNLIILFSVLIVGAVVGSLFNNIMAGLGISYILFILYFLAIIIPSIAVIARRLHDINKSGWFYCVSFIPFIGGIWALVLLCTDGDQNTNQYGPDPKNELDEINEIGTSEA